MISGRWGSDGRWGISLGWEGGKTEKQGCFFARCVCVDFFQFFSDSDGTMKGHREWGNTRLKREIAIKHG